jgi:hypothetical protein
MLLFLLPVPLLADTTYTYTGNPFTVAVSPYTTSDYVSGSFTVVGGPLSCSSGCTVNPLSFDFSDGVQHITNNDGHVNVFTITTSGSGSIMNWEWFIYNSAYSGYISSYGYAVVASDQGVNNVDGGGAEYGINMQSKGSWSTSPVPEPATLILLGSGLAGLAGVRRRKFLG